MSGNKEIINIIRDFGVNPLSRDKSGNTPFSIVMNKNVDVIKCVLGNNTSITDSDGNSPIHIVVNSNGSTKLLEFLIEEGYPRNDSLFHYTEKDIKRIKKKWNIPEAATFLIVKE